jgi:hypothetical protein
MTVIRRTDTTNHCHRALPQRIQNNTLAPPKLYPTLYVALARLGEYSNGVEYGALVFTPHPK